MTGRDFRIDVFNPCDASGVTELFTCVYGDSYPIRLVYDPDALVAAFERSENIPVVARTPEGRVVGYTALYNSAPNKGVYEVGLTLVLPEYRRTPIAGLMLRRMMRKAFSFSRIETVFGELVCNHTHMQRGGTMHKTVETAIEVDLMPADAYETEQSASGRVSTVAVFKTIVPKPHMVFVPAVYEPFFSFVYDGFDDPREFAPSREELPGSLETKISTQIFDFAQVARVAVEEAGGDFAGAFAREERSILEQNVIVIQVWLNLSRPCVAKAAEQLRLSGYFLGGILSRWLGEDALLMQKILQRPNWEGIYIYTDRARRILDVIREDWESVSRY